MTREEYYMNQETGDVDTWYKWVKKSESDDPWNEFSLIEVIEDENHNWIPLEV